MTVSKLRGWLEGILETKRSLNQTLQRLAEGGHYQPLSVLSIVGDHLSHVNDNDISEPLRLLEMLSDGDVKVLDRCMAEEKVVAIAVVNLHPSQPTGGAKTRKSRSKKEIEAERAKVSELREAVKELHKQNPKQSNRELRGKLPRKFRRESLPRISGFRAVLNGVGFHRNGGNGRRGPRKKTSESK